MAAAGHAPPGRPFSALGALIVVWASLAMVPHPTPGAAGGAGWKRADTEHFLLFSNASDRATRKVALRLEKLRLILSHFFQDIEVRSPVPTYIYIFRNASTFQPFNPWAERSPTATAGFFSPGVNANRAAINIGLPGAPYGTVYHEYVHYIIHNNFIGVPLWLDEGLAEYYSTFRSNKKIAEIGRPVADHVHWLIHHRLIPLPVLFSITRDSPQYHGDSKSGIFYAESWALVHYLLRGNPVRTPQTVHFLELLDRGSPVDEAFQAAFGVTYQELLIELLQYVTADDLSGRASFPFTRTNISDLGFQAKVRIEPLRPSDALCRLGDLLAHTQPEKTREAGELFAEARSLDPSSPLPYAGLGELSLARKEYHQAAALLAQAMDRDPHNALYPLLRGEAYLMQVARTLPPLLPGQFRIPAHPPLLDQARRMFRASLAIDPGRGHAYARLGESFLIGTQDAVPGIQALETAHRLLPKETNVVYNLVLLSLDRGERDKARALVEEVLAPIAPPAQTASARALVLDAHLAHLEKLIAGDEIPEALALIRKLLPRLPDREPRSLAARQRDQPGPITQRSLLQGQSRRALQLFPEDDRDARQRWLENLQSQCDHTELCDRLENMLDKLQDMEGPHQEAPAAPSSFLRPPTQGAMDPAAPR
ncbi:MAG: DUF1570 domain-containing protein [Acidobacteriota bacterium]